MLLIQVRHELPVDVIQHLFGNVLRWYHFLKENDDNALSTLCIFGKVEEAFGSLGMKEKLFLTLNWSFKTGSKKLITL